MSEKPPLTAAGTLSLVDALPLLALREWRAWDERKAVWDAAPIKTEEEQARLDELEYALGRAVLAVIADGQYGLTAIVPGGSDRISIDKGLLPYLSIRGWRNGILELYREDVLPPRLAFVGVLVLGIVDAADLSRSGTDSELEQILQRLAERETELAHKRNATATAPLIPLVRHLLTEGKIRPGMTVKQVAREVRGRFGDESFPEKSEKTLSRLLGDIGL